MTKSILDQLEEADKAATPAPWVSDFAVVKRSDEAWILIQHRSIDDSLNAQKTPNTELTALMRNNIRNLLDIARACDEYFNHNSSPNDPFHYDITARKFQEIRQVLAKLKANE